MTDARSPLAVKILSANPHAYEALVVEGATPALANELLEGVQPAQLLTVPVASLDSANAMLAGLWLWHDGLDESHTISQSISSPTGSFWHAIMHRREGDFSNSKYWYARVGSHPVLEIMAHQAGSIVNQFPADKSLLRLVATGWNPNAFVDLAQAVHDAPQDLRYRAAVQLQQLEWKMLFDHCARA
jgi:hypothetical protein